MRLNSLANLIHEVVYVFRKQHISTKNYCSIMPEKRGQIPMAYGSDHINCVPCTGKPNFSQK